MDCITISKDFNCKQNSSSCRYTASPHFVLLHQEAGKHMPAHWIFTPKGSGAPMVHMPLQRPLVYMFFVDFQVLVYTSVLDQGNVHHSVQYSSAGCFPLINPCNVACALGRHCKGQAKWDKQFSTNFCSFPQKSAPPKCRIF